MLRLHNNHKKIISDMYFSYNTVLNNKDSTILLFFDFLLLSNTILCRHIGIQQNDQEYAIYHKRLSLNINHNENLQSDERKVGTQKIKHFSLTIQLRPSKFSPSIYSVEQYLSDLQNSESDRTEVFIGKIEHLFEAFQINSYTCCTQVSEVISTTVEVIVIPSNIPSHIHR